MRIPLDSPFSPGSDNVPQVWAGRTRQLNDWSTVLRPRRLAGIPERGRTILGEAGLGKSSLVRRIAADAASRGDWVTPQLRIPSGSDPLKRVASALLEVARTAGLPTSRNKKIGELMSRVETVAAAGISLTLREHDGPEPYSTLTELLLELGRAALRSGDVVVLIHIDEVQNISSKDALSQLLIALGDAITHEEEIEAPGGYVVRRALPIAVYLTGLPEFAARAGAAKGATFARRFQTTTLKPIEHTEVLEALQPFVINGWDVSDGQGSTEKIRMTPEAQDQIASLCCGEPFLFQLAGEQAWYASTEPVITREHVLTGWKHGADEAAVHVQRILDRLPPKELDFLEAMAGLEPEQRTLTNIAATAGFAKTSQAGSISRRLDTERGIISRGRNYTFRHRAVGAYLTSNWPDVFPD